MRALKLCGAAALVVMAAAALAAGASGDSICKAKEAPCVTNPWPVGTTFEAKIKAGTNFKFDGFRHYTCSESTRADRLISNNIGGKGLPATLEPKGETYSGCTSIELGTCTAVTTAAVQTVRWFADAAGTWNGFTNSPSTAATITLNCSSGLNCKWLYHEQIAHTYKGGSPATEYLKAQYVRSESNMFCGTEVIIEGEREITSPNTSPIYWSYG